VFFNFSHATGPNTTSCVSPPPASPSSPPPCLPRGSPTCSACRFVSCARAPAGGAPAVRLSHVHFTLSLHHIFWNLCACCVHDTYVRSVECLQHPGRLRGSRRDNLQPKYQNVDHSHHLPIFSLATACILLVHRSGWTALHAREERRRQTNSKPSNLHRHGFIHSQHELCCRPRQAARVCPPGGGGWHA
jgi:hypothetical protein